MNKRMICLTCVTFLFICIITCLSANAEDILMDVLETEVIENQAETNDIEDEPIMQLLRNKNNFSESQ